MNRCRAFRQGSQQQGAVRNAFRAGERDAAFGAGNGGKVEKVRWIPCEVEK